MNAINNIAQFAVTSLATLAVGAVLLSATLGPYVA